MTELSIVCNLQSVLLQNHNYEHQQFVSGYVCVHTLLTINCLFSSSSYISLTYFVSHTLNLFRKLWRKSSFLNITQTQRLISDAEEDIKQLVCNIKPVEASAAAVCRGKLYCFRSCSLWRTCAGSATTDWG